MNSASSMDQTEGIFEKALAKSDVIFSSEIFKRPESLAKYLPYDEFLEGRNIVVNKDGSLGALYEFRLLEHEVMTTDHIVSAVDGLKSWFSFSENFSLQVMFEQRVISPLDSRFQRWRDHHSDGHPVSETLFEKRLSLLKEFSKVKGAFTPMERKGYISVRYFPDHPKRKTGVFEFFKDPEHTLLKEAKAFSDDLTHFQYVLSSLESASPLKLTRVDGSGLTDILRRLFNPKTYFERSFAPFNPNHSISDQVIFSSPRLSFEGIEREGVKTRTLSLKTSPRFSYPGGMAYFVGLSFPFRISQNFSFPSKAAVKKFFDVKEFFLQNTPSARAKRQREEVLEVQNRLARDDRCLHMTFAVTIEGVTDEELEDRTRATLNVFNQKLECEVIVEKDIGLGLYLNTLPLNYTPKSDLSTQRFIRILRSDAVRFLPIFDSFRGLRDPLQVYLSRENNLIKFSLLENETSNHTVVLADSGSGKSSFVIDAVQAAKRMSPEPLIFVIDKKSSYLTLAEYYDADLTIFERGEKMPFSPFRGVFDDDKVAFLTTLITTGIGLLSPSFTVEADHMALISKAIRLAYDRKVKEASFSYEKGEIIEKETVRDPAFGMDDIIAELSTLTALPEYEKFGDAVEKLLQKMAPFYSDGIYAPYFRGTAGQGKNTAKLFFIYDLDALDGDKTLQTLMTMAVVEEIRQIIKLHEGEGRQGFIILEEMQMLGGKGNEVGGSFALDAAQTFRKLGVWLIALTPRPQNYFETAVGEALWGVADNFIFLQMSSDNVEYLKKRSTILDEASTEIIKSLRTVRGQYADVFYMNKKKTSQGAFRFFQTPFDRWLAPTNPKAVKRLKETFEMFAGEKWKALNYLAEKFADGEEKQSQIERNGDNE